MSTRTTTRKTRTGKPAAPEAAPVNVLDTFEEQLVHRSDLLGKYESGAVFAKVLFAETIAAMHDAVDNDTPPLAADASKTAIRERRDGIRNRVLLYVESKTGRSYTWASIAAWTDAARVNATLPEPLQVREESDGTIVGTFNTWALVALGRVEDEARRATMAEQLASEGLTSEDAVTEAVRQENGEDAPSAPEPKAAAKMVEALVKKVKKQHGQVLGANQVLASQIGDDSLTLADFGRLVFALTPSDAAVTDKEQRARKRLQVFRAAIEELLFADEEAVALADGDGINDADAVQ